MEIFYNIEKYQKSVISEINNFTFEKFSTKGGRMGSGMGLLLEGLWCYFVNTSLKKGAYSFEIGWLPDNQYNDYACINSFSDWVPDNKQGEYFRIEAKSMNVGADEPKGHFDEIEKNIGKDDSLLVILWEWEQDSGRNYPKVNDIFFGSALKIALLRDSMHIARGGSFLPKECITDFCNCNSMPCSYFGEPLNASNIRERRHGPPTARGKNVSYAANFGGLLRMIKTSNNLMRKSLINHLLKCSTSMEYVSFIHKNFPKEERNSFLTKNWIALAEKYSIKNHKNNIKEIQSLLRNKNVNYHKTLIEDS